MTYRFENTIVLLIDNHPAMVDLIGRVLQTFGVKRILTQMDGSQGLETFVRERPDLVIIDYDLLSISGMEFAAAVRSGTINPYVPIIFMTSLSSEDCIVSARDSGITEFLKKPFTAEALYQRIVNVIEHPRSFIHSTGFIGPDRRRREDKDAYTGQDRREED